MTEYERAFNTVLDAAVLQWAANTNQGELREALDRCSGNSVTMRCGVH